MKTPIYHSCIICGAAFEKIGTGSARKKTCSKDCSEQNARNLQNFYNLENRKELSDKCIVCSKPFNRKRKEKICSDKCRTDRKKQYVKKNKKQKVVECVVCSKPFDRKGKERICSEQCRETRCVRREQERWGKDIWICGFCITCKKSIIYLPKGPGKRPATCSEECKSERRKNTRRKHYEKNIEHVLEYARQYAIENKNRLKEIRKEYYLKNQEKMKNYGKQYYHKRNPPVYESCIICGDVFQKTGGTAKTCSKTCSDDHLRNYRKNRECCPDRREQKRIKRARRTVEDSQYAAREKQRKQEYHYKNREKRMSEIKSHHLKYQSAYDEALELSLIEPVKTYDEKLKAGRQILNIIERNEENVRSN